MEAVFLPLFLLRKKKENQGENIIVMIIKYIKNISYGGLLMTRKLPSLDLTRNYDRIRDEIKQAIDKVLESQHFILGPEVDTFESEIKQYLQVDYAVGCASGTDALLLSLMALDIGEGDEVITTPYSFFATVSCITRLGATPVFADVDPVTCNIDCNKVLEKVTERTKAFIPVHIFGQMVPMEDLHDEMVSRGIAIVEDSAQAFGSWRQINDRIIRAGTWGNIGCFSFFPTKNLGGYGDGGMISCSDNEMADRISCLRVHGAGKTYYHDEVGLNSRLDAIQAAILRVKLRHLDEWQEERRLVADRYRMLFAEKGLLDFITPPFEIEGNYHIYHQYVTTGVSRRDELMEYLQSSGIACRVYYPVPLHLQKCFSYTGYSQGDFPIAERLSEETLALPIFPELTEDEQDWVVSTIADFYKKNNS